MHIVLVEPEIPQNTGNIARTCAATGVSLHLVKPLGFSLDEKHVKRAGLDYWEMLDLHIYENFAELQEKYPQGKFFYATTKAKKTYCQMKYCSDSFFVFGKETKGLPEELLMENPETCIRIPMKETIRSLNLSNSAAIVVYEALRQQNFHGLEEKSDFLWKET